VEVRLGRRAVESVSKSPGTRGGLPDPVELEEITLAELFFPNGIID
jgi:hypothetical protein